MNGFILSNIKVIRIFEMFRCILFSNNGIIQQIVEDFQDLKFFKNKLSDICADCTNSEN
jgi:hypothetical protein